MLIVVTESYAQGFKPMTIQAIIEGSSSGTIDEIDNTITKNLFAKSKSHAPVNITMKRVEQYSNECAMLLISITQKGTDIIDGKPVDFDTSFNLPICIDGSYPQELKAKDDARWKNEMASCNLMVKKGKIENHHANGTIEFKGCPKNGKVGMHYDGTCQRMNPGPGAQVVEYLFDDKGALTVKLQLPEGCVDAKNTNRWRAYIFEKQGPKYPRQLIGDKYVNW